MDAWSDLPVDASTPVFASVYDPNGNALTITDPSGTRTFTYDATNRIEILAGPSGITTFTYDDSGQLLKKQAPMGATTTYTWDGDGRLIKAELPGSFVFTMVYDCQGMLAMVPLEPTVAGLRQLPTGQTTLALYVGVPPGSPIFRNAYTAATRTPPFPSSRTIRSSAGFNSSSFRFPADIAPANRTTHSSSASACAITAVPRGSHNGCNPSTQFARVTASPLLNCPCNSPTARSSTESPTTARPPPAPCPAHPTTAIAKTPTTPPTHPRFIRIPHQSKQPPILPPIPPPTQRPAPIPTPTPLLLLLYTFFLLFFPTPPGKHCPPYQPHYQFRQPLGAPNWKPDNRNQRSFYLKSRGGKAFAALNITASVRPRLKSAFFSISGVMNDQGSPNLFVDAP